MKGPLGDDARVNHVLDAIAEVQRYIAGVTENEFLRNSEKRFATIKQIEIIGEACNKITRGLKAAHPEVTWREIIGFRNISIHEYHEINMDVVWDTACRNLPDLKKQFEDIKKELHLSVEKQEKLKLDKKADNKLLPKKKIKGKKRRL